ncbi:MAG: carbon-nitrogen hydrolase family protein [Deltaproteobacteria bacterium]|nr:carbon-nitrogen hydrolase family protein [Deltaproteobacteria bacterium]
MNEIKISLLHLALEPGALARNYALLERAIRTASALQADWVVAPELSISGYEFNDAIGTGWMAVHPDSWTLGICRLASILKLTILFGHAECDTTGCLYNVAIMVSADGLVMARHRKINTRAESWATPGKRAQATDWNGLVVGIVICADAYTRDVAEDLRGQGAQLLISPAAWGPGLHGPEGEWEQRTRETGLPLVVCNRTGPEKKLDFTGAESLFVKHGKKLLSYWSERSAVLTFDLDLKEMMPLASDFSITYLSSGTV